MQRPSKPLMRSSPPPLVAFNSVRADMDANRIADIKQRLKQLDRLLSHYVPPTPTDNPSESTVDEAEFWAARFEERVLLQTELDALLKRRAG
jgi:hypothetical protein